ncbi:MAG: serine hydrolase domain-containing protein [Bryobacteraceae bacterium]
MSMLTRRNFTGLLLAGSQAPRLFGASIDDTFRASVARRGVPSAVAMAVDVNRVLYSGAVGKRDAASNVMVNADSIFQIASMTKPITAVAAMQLVEQGKVTLDEPVSKYLPQLANPQVLTGFTSTGDPILRPAKTAITLRHLLTHTSGISYPTWHPEMFKYSQKVGVGPTSIAPVVPLMFEPGTNWQYGYSADWTGRLVEALSGQTLQQYFRVNILDPLGMKDTEFGVDPAKFDRMVTVYQRTDQGKFDPRPRVQPAAPTDFNGGGGLSSTVNDYVKFTRMILRHGVTGINTEILKARSVELMMKNQIGDLRAGFMKSFQPNVSSDVDTHPGGVDKWGLGFLLQGAGSTGMRQEGSMSWAGIFNTYFWIDPHRGISGVIMMQYLPFFDKEAVGLLGDFERSVYANI